MNRVLLLASCAILTMGCGLEGARHSAKDGAEKINGRATPTEGEVTMMTASGDFEIGLTPQTDDDFEAGRMTIDKVYSGDLVGSGKGQMLSMRSAVQGSGAYVAIERVSGTLHGKTGTFALQHSGVMSAGQSELKVMIVPDSGTDGLSGLTGSMTIDAQDGKHSYELAYRLVD